MLDIRLYSAVSHLPWWGDSCYSTNPLPCQLFHCPKPTMPLTLHWNESIKRFNTLSKLAEYRTFVTELLKDVSYIGKPTEKQKAVWCILCQNTHTKKRGDCFGGASSVKGWKPTWWRFALRVYHCTWIVFPPASEVKPTCKGCMQNDCNNIRGKIITYNFNLENEYCNKDA